MLRKFFVSDGHVLQYVVTRVGRNHLFSSESERSSIVIVDIRFKPGHTVPQSPRQDSYDWNTVIYLPCGRCFFLSETHIDARLTKDVST